MIPPPKSLLPALRPYLAKVAGLAALLGLSSCANVNVVNPQTNVRLAPAPYFDSATGIYFPGALGPLFRKPVVSLEERSPGLGLAIRYRNEEAHIDLFVYDLQASIIPTGNDSDVIQKSFQDAIADLKKAANKGIYNQLEILEPNLQAITQTTFRHVRFEYTEGLQPKTGQLFVTGVNGQILKIRTALRRGSSIDTQRLLAYLGRSIEQSRRDGYGGISNRDFSQISKQLSLIDLSDGLSESEAISIAQIELVENKLHNQYDATTGQARRRDQTGSVTVEFSQYPTIPARQLSTPIRIRVTPSGLAEIARAQR